MDLYNDYQLLAGSDRSSGRVVTIGNFDGVHRGHQAVIGTSRKLAENSALDFAICTFEPHPAELFAREPRLRLVTPRRKYQLLADCGVELVLAQNFSRTFAAIPAADFAQKVLGDALKAKKVVVGSDFRFGANREGTVGLLRELGADLGFDVLGEELTEDGGTPISSSRIRQALLDGEVGRASRMLGRFHEVPGNVVKGYQAGSAMGFPTINLLSPDVLIPADGIYAALCDLPDGRVVQSAMYVGDRPTLGHGRSLEAHLIDFSGDLYEQDVRVRFVDRIRGDMKFDGADALRDQIEKDVATAKEMLEAVDE